MRTAMAFMGATLFGAALVGGCGSSSGGGTGASGTGGAYAFGACSTDIGGYGGPCGASEDCSCVQGECSGSELDPCGLTAHPLCLDSAQCSTNIGCDVDCEQACGQCTTCAADKDCFTAQVCDATSHTCVPQPCQTDGECPTNFTCAQGSCARKTCSQDSDCQGVCTHGFCVSKLGTCHDCG